MIKFIKSLFRLKISAAFAYGRFNPAHKGHIKLWSLVQQTSKNWYIGTNPNTNDNKNPLSFNDKKLIVESLYPDIRGHFIAEQTILTLASTIYKQLGCNPKLSIAYITDETDWKWSGALLHQYNGQIGTHGFYNFKNIIHIASPRMSSATEMRLAVDQKNETAFYEISGVDPTLLINNKPYFEIVSAATSKTKKVKSKVNT
jgi:hypothetical protein